MSEQDALVQRWTELYGANRCLAREAVQARHRQDHVEQNFMEGLEKVPSNHIFQTTTAGEFRVCILFVAFADVCIGNG